MTEAQGQIESLQNVISNLTENLDSTQIQVGSLRNTSTKLGEDLDDAKADIDELTRDTINLSQDLAEAVDLLSAQVQLTKELPGTLDTLERSRLVASVQEHWNNGEYENLYNMFGDYGKTFVDADEIVVLLSNLRTVCGNLEAASYSHFEYSGEENGADFFGLSYVGRFEQASGTIIITVRAIDGASEVAGININCEF